MPRLRAALSRASRRVAGARAVPVRAWRALWQAPRCGAHVGLPLATSLTLAARGALARAAIPTWERHYQLRVPL